jgi:4'-phosphopantetheinyl transferase
MDEPVSFILRPDEAAGQTLPLVLLAAPMAASARLDLHRRMVAAFAGCPAENVLLATGDSGEPLPFSPARAGRLFLSRSASGGCTALALAREPVGVDVAREDGGPLPFDVLSLPDRQEFAACPDEASRRRLFMRIWAAKEAYLKALGTGLMRDPATVSIRGADRIDPRAVDAEDARQGLRARFRLWASLDSGADAGQADAKEEGALPVLPEGAILCLCRIV